MSVRKSFELNFKGFLMVLDCFFTKWQNYPTASLYLHSLVAQVAKLVNVAVSEAVAVIGLRVRVSPWAQCSL